MKTRVLLTMTCLFGMVSIANAQLSVDSLGGVYMPGGVSSLKNKVAIGTPNNNTFYKHCNFVSTLRGNSSVLGSRIAIYGDATESVSSSTSNVGVYGRAGGCPGTNDNFGVWGKIDNSKGAAIYGICGNSYAPPVYGSYAGLFSGPVSIYGTLTATSVVSSSDIALKENIAPLESVSKGMTALDNVMAMNAVRYNYTDKIEAEKNLHFGLIAQELQEIYPNLVVKDQGGYLGINYVELVPVLIRSIQELKAELDELKGKDTTARRATYAGEETTGVLATDAHLEKSVLYQNTPNPFSSQTQIRFTLPDSTKNAYIYIFDMNGKMQKQIAIDSSMDSVTINGYELSAGIYLYSLVVNGQEIDTKRMILSK